MSVDITMGKQLEFGVPRMLFQTRVTTGSTDISRVLRYDVTRDGKRFLINSELENAKTSLAPITVVLNWASALSN